jgi:Fe-S oxidoreductase
MQETFTNLENQFNPWGFSSDSRADWCKGMDVPLMTDNPDAELLYFVGCSGSFDDRGKKIAQAMARVLQKADVNFAILGPEEVCNGDMARRAGNEYIAQILMMQNIEVFDQYKPKKILTGCPHCYNIIKNEYPQFGANYEVVHHTELLLGLFQQSIWGAGTAFIRPPGIYCLRLPTVQSRLKCPVPNPRGSAAGPVAPECLWRKPSASASTKSVPKK